MTTVHDVWLRDHVRGLSSLSEGIERARDVAHLCRRRVEQHDIYTKEHSVRVATWSKVIAGRLPTFDRDRLLRLEITALVHDYGKIDVPAEILNKPVPLTRSEFEEVKRHPELGARRLEPFAEFVDMDGVLYHHVRFDGGGYPAMDARRHEIPLSARIIAVADTFDALTSDRAYRKGLSPLLAFRMMRAVGGSQLDPTLVRIFETYYNAERATKGYNVGAETMQLGAVVDEEVRRAREFLRRRVGDYDRRNPLAKVANREQLVAEAVELLISLDVDRDMAEKFVRHAFLLPQRETFRREDIGLDDAAYAALLSGANGGTNHHHAEITLPLVRRRPEYECPIAVFDQKLWKNVGDGSRAVLLR